MYKALIDIGEYKKDDVVPTDKAEVWMKMYEISPVALVVSGESEKKQILKEEEFTHTEINPMLDDYLARNEGVVVKNIRVDKLNKDQLSKLLSIEKSLKKRKKVIKAINKKIEGFN